MKHKQTLPPKWADKLLSWFCKEEVLEIIQGDLHEVHQKRVTAIGPHRANLLYLRDVISVLRPRLMKRSEGTHRLNQYGIFKNHLTTSIRNLKHNALFSGINIVGLAMSMSVGILMIILLSELHSFDDFHKKKNNIYRVTTSRKAIFQGEAEFFASAPHFIADKIEDKVSGVEQVVVLERGMSADLKIENQGIAVSGYYATAPFLDVFSFNLKKGNTRTALQNPGAIILTESAAKRLFGDTDPINKTIQVEGNSDFNAGVITGVVEDPPINSHLNFEALVSMKTLENSLLERRRNFKNNPGRYAQSYVYVVLKDGASVAHIETIMANAMADHNSKSAPNNLSLQPMEEFVVRNAGLQPGPSFPKQKINIMIGLTIIVLLSACFNYTNLSLVRALRRSKEVSVRKITGATRHQIFSQFMTEALLLSFVALIAGVGMFLLIKPEFLSLPALTASGSPMFRLRITPVHVMYFIIFTLSVGAVAGFFPALVLSKLKASSLFNGASKIKLFSGVTLRQILITAQIALSIGLIMCTVIVHKQYTYALDYDLGYDTEDIINVRIKGDYVDVLENEYAEITGVVETSRSSITLGTRTGNPADGMSEDQSDTIMFSCNYVDHNYLRMHGFELIAGREFLPSNPGERQHHIIVNERFLKELNLGKPEEAIGKHIWYFGEEKLKIQGVVKDFVSMSLDARAPEAFGFLNRPADDYGILGVKVSHHNLFETMQNLENAYKRIDPVHPFEARFYDDQIARTYEDSKATYTIVSFLALLAICISSLGLLGMAVFNIETRMKEISIRKVLGAGISNLTIMLSRSFFVMIIIAASIAIPTTHYIIDDMVLNKFLYRTNIGIVEMTSGLTVVMLIGLITIGWQVRRAALQNPSDLLRDE